MGKRILNFSAKALKSYSVVVVSRAGLLKHQWCIVTVFSAVSDGHSPGSKGQKGYQCWFLA